MRFSLENKLACLVMFTLGSQSKPTMKENMNPWTPCKFQTTAKYCYIYVSDERQGRILHFAVSLDDVLQMFRKGATAHFTRDKQNYDKL